MFYIKSTLIGVISGFIPLLPMMALFHFIMLKKDRKNNMKTAIPHMAVVYMFCFTLLAVLSVTGIPDLYYLTVDTTINLVPFTDIFTNVLQYVLNILLFVPIGFLLPMLWEKFEKIHLTFICGFSFSLSIEIIQIFSYRATDIDDLLMNTTGTIIGYFIFVLAKKLFPKVSIFAIGHTNHWKCEPYFCFCFAWLSMFFIQPFISSWLWGFVLG